MSANVLVVDDAETVRKSVSDLLLSAGFQVTEAVDGQDGVDKIKAGNFDCVICDLHMPRKNGVELVSEVKREQEYAALPIMMLTTEGSAELAEQAREAGAIGWMVKPFKPVILVDAVSSLTSTAR